MPAQKPGRSWQDVGTPEWLIQVVNRTWGEIVVDIAASDENHVCPHYLTKEVNALEYLSFRSSGVIWCNPPYSDIRPWVAQAENTGIDTTEVMLVPASVGSNWWRDHVHGKASIYFIPRIKFKRHAQVYPKDLALLVYGPNKLGHGPGYWTMKVSEKEQIPIFAPGHMPEPESRAIGSEGPWRCVCNEYETCQVCIYPANDNGVA